jgi:hypothetical protein
MSNASERAPKGARFGKLVVTGAPYTPVTSTNHVKYVKCLCDCGAVDEARVVRLLSGKKKACRQCSWSAAHRKHGDSNSTEFKTWVSVLHRSGRRADGSRAVSKSKSVAAKSVRRHYWKRGVDIDPRWFSYENFLSDMGRRPPDCVSLDRKDNERGYWPDNCRWATHSEQMSNTRRSILVTHSGKTQTLTAWARELGFVPGTLIVRYAAGYRPPELFRPTHPRIHRKKS